MFNILWDYLIDVRYPYASNFLENSWLQVVWVVDGKVHQAGTYQELLSGGRAFEELMGERGAAEDGDNFAEDEEAHEEDEGASGPLQPEGAVVATAGSATKTLTLTGVRLKKRT